MDGDHTSREAGTAHTHMPTDTPRAVSQLFILAVSLCMALVYCVAALFTESTFYCC